MQPNRQIHWLEEKQQKCMYRQSSIMYYIICYFRKKRLHTEWKHLNQTRHLPSSKACSSITIIIHLSTLNQQGTFCTYKYLMRCQVILQFDHQSYYDLDSIPSNDYFPVKQKVIEVKQHLHTWVFFNFWGRNIILSFVTLRIFLILFFKYFCINIHEMTAM